MGGRYVSKGSGDWTKRDLDDNGLVVGKVIPVKEPKITIEISKAADDVVKSPKPKKKKRG